MTTSYYSIRNMGYFEDMLEWVKNWLLLHRAIEACSTCMDYRMWKLTEKKHKAESKKKGSSSNDLRIMFLIKTQF